MGYFIPDARRYEQNLKLAARYGFLLYHQLFRFTFLTTHHSYFRLHSPHHSFRFFVDTCCRYRGDEIVVAKQTGPFFPQMRKTCLLDLEGESKQVNEESNEKKVGERFLVAWPPDLVLEEKPTHDTTT